MDLAQYKLDILGVQETRLQEQEIDLGDHKLYLSDSWLTGVKSRQGGVGVAVIAEVSMKLLTIKPCFTPRISSAKLQDETTRDLFTQEVKLHLDKSGNFENTEQSWDNFRKALNQAAVKCLLPDKRVNKPWISPDSLELIRKRADLQLKKHSSAVALLEFTNFCKEVRKALRADKRAWLERKGQEVQSFADRGNLKEVFGASQQICRNWSPQLTKLFQALASTYGRKRNDLNAGRNILVNS